MNNSSTFLRWFEMNFATRLWQSAHKRRYLNALKDFGANTLYGGHSVGYACTQIMLSIFTACCSMYAMHFPFIRWLLVGCIAIEVLYWKWCCCCCCCWCLWCWQCCCCIRFLFLESTWHKSFKRWKNILRCHAMRWINIGNKLHWHEKCHQQEFSVCFFLLSVVVAVGFVVSNFNLWIFGAQHCICKTESPLMQTAFKC